MVELLIGLGASFSIVVLVLLFYLSLKHRDFYRSEEGRRHIERRKNRFKAAAVLGIAAFFLFVGIELMEASEVIGMEPASMEGLEESLEIVQLAFLILAQLLMLSIAVETKRGEKSVSS